MLYDENLVNTIKDILCQRKQTIAVAESVTAGHLQAALSSAVEASHFFQGGITAYNLGQKCRHLQVNPISAEGCNCVSEEVAGMVTPGCQTDKVVPVLFFIVCRFGVIAQMPSGTALLTYEARSIRVLTTSLARNRRALILQEKTL